MTSQLVRNYGTLRVQAALNSASLQTNPAVQRRSSHAPPADSVHVLTAGGQDRTTRTPATAPAPSTTSAAVLGSTRPAEGL